MSTLAAMPAAPVRGAGAAPGERLAAGALVLTIVLWASAFAGIRVALRHFGPEHLSILRLAVASMVLGAIATARGGVRVPARRDLPGLVLVAFTGMTAYQVLLNSGEVSVPASTASLLVNVSPLFTAILAVTLLGERLPGRARAGLALGFGGAALVAVARGGGVGFDARALLVLGAAVAQATFFVAQKALLDRSRLDAFDVTAWAMWLGTAMLLPFAARSPARGGDRARGRDRRGALPRRRRVGARVRVVGVRVGARPGVVRRLDALRDPGRRGPCRVGLAGRDAGRARRRRRGRGDRRGGAHGSRRDRRSPAQPAGCWWAVPVTAPTPVHAPPGGRRSPPGCVLDP